MAAQWRVHAALQYSLGLLRSAGMHHSLDLGLGGHGARIVPARDGDLKVLLGQAQRHLIPDARVAACCSSSSSRMATAEVRPVRGAILPDPHEFICGRRP